MSAVHVSLRVRNLENTVGFYRRFLGEPVKLKSDYAKFVTQDPEIHLALMPGLDSSAEAGSLSHLGIRVGSTDEVARWRADLRARGLTLDEEKRTECCYALQEKFWVTDPDGNRWEIYTVLEDVERMAPARLSPGAPSDCCPPTDSRQESARCC